MPRVALLYQIGLPSNTATPLALFGGSLRIKLHSSSIRTNRAIVLKGSCIRSITCFSRIELLWLGDLRLQRKQRFRATDQLDGIYTSEIGVILIDGRTQGQTVERPHFTTYMWRGMDIAY